MPNKPWTENELNVLLSFKNKKNAKVEGRSKKSIRRKLIQLGIIKPKFKVEFHNKKRWTEKEIEILKSLKEKSYIYLPNRSKDSITRMLSKLKLRNKSKYRKPWKKKEEILLKKLVSEGKTPSEIFRMNILNYSRNSIQKKMCFLGLSKKTSKCELLSKDNLGKFKKFLQENWVGKTPEDLVELWNKENIIKTNYKKTLYHLYKLKIKIPYAEVSIIKNLRKKEEEITNKQIGDKTTKALSDSIRFARAEVMRKRILKNRDIWSGLPLSENLTDGEDNE